MEVKTKFDINARVWFIHNNKVDYGIIHKINITLIEGRNLFITYTIYRDIIFEENKIFATKEELIKSL